LTCPIHQIECLCFNRAAEFCGKHNHRILWDEYGVCEKCSQNVSQQKRDRLILREFFFGCPVCIGGGQHTHMYCRVHRRYLGLGEENMEKCYKCHEEYDDRALKIRMRIVERLIIDYLQQETTKRMQRYFQNLRNQKEN
jgi:hypothetical protein